MRKAIWDYEGTEWLQQLNDAFAVKRRVHVLKPYRESPDLLRRDGWKFVEDGLGASHRSMNCFL